MEKVMTMAISLLVLLLVDLEDQVPEKTPLIEFAQLSHLMPAPLLISFRASFMVTSIISMISCSEVA